jgi:RNA 3'-terminal phosphate cyclase (ATP)
LQEEISLAGEVDEYLQDQLIFFQAVSEGYSSFQRLDSPASSEDLDDISETLAALESSDKDTRKAKTTEPFGNGSLHTKTARWVAAEMLPEVDFFKKGDIVKGAGIVAS